MAVLGGHSFLTGRRYIWLLSLNIKIFSFHSFSLVYLLSLFQRIGAKRLVVESSCYI
jgi:hypothetical protein